MTDAVVTTSKIETSFTGAASVGLTSAKADVFHGGDATVKLTSTKLEEFSGGNANVKVTTVKIEIFRSNSAPPVDVETCERDQIIRKPKAPVYCIPPPRSRFRKFWATQLNACPSEDADPNCADPNGLLRCEGAGLQLQYQYDPCFQELNWKGGTFSQCGQNVTGATISTDNWVAGLMINILGTNAQQAKSICGNRPGQKGGYWLDDISGAKSGSSIRYIPTTGYTVNQQVEYVRQTALVDMNKLITYGVAKSVAVSAKYLGRQTIGLIITAVGVDDITTVVNSSITKISNAWVWN